MQCDDEDGPWGIQHEHEHFIEQGYYALILEAA